MGRWETLTEKLNKEEEGRRKERAKYRENNVEFGFFKINFRSTGSGNYHNDLLMFVTRKLEWRFYVNKIYNDTL